MVEIKCEGGMLGNKPKDTFYMNKDLKENLDIELSTMKQSVQDLVILIDGVEGSGKSKAARQVAYYCSQMLGSKFDRDGVKNIHNDIDKYIQSCLKGGEFQVNILDESRNALLRIKSTSKDAVRFTNFMSECRSLRQVHILLLPAFHDLDKYLVLWRMNFLIHLKKNMKVDPTSKGGYKLDLGDFRIFANDSFTKLFYDEKYKYPKKFAGRDRFPNFEVLSAKGLEAYEKQKTALMGVKYGNVKLLKVGRMNGVERAKNILEYWKNLKCPHCEKKIEVSDEDQAKIFQIAPESIRANRKYHERMEQKKKDEKKFMDVIMANPKN